MNPLPHCPFFLSFFLFPPKQWQWETGFLDFHFRFCNHDVPGCWTWVTGEISFPQPILIFRICGTSEAGTGPLCFSYSYWSGLVLIAFNYMDIFLCWSFGISWCTIITFLSGMLVWDISVTIQGTFWIIPWAFKACFCAHESHNFVGMIVFPVCKWNLSNIILKWDNFEELVRLIIISTDIGISV